MSKTIKITKTQISKMINEEVKRFEKIKILENKRAEIARTLTEMYDIQELSEMGVDEGMLGNIGASIKKAFTGAWSQEEAQKAYMQTYPKFEKDYAAKLGIDVATLRTALINTMMQIGGLAILSGQGQNVEWDATTKTFKRLASKMGGASSGTGAMGGSY